MALGLDFLTQIINVHWGGKLHFMYSGADGIYGSKDGESWKKAESSVPATSLAWVNDVWIGIGPGGAWRSEDGAKTWTPASGLPSACKDVVAMIPEATTENGEPKKGIFATWADNEEEQNAIVYTSHDLGLSWGAVLTIPMTVGEDGYESVRGLSGCGAAFFVCTGRGATATHNGDGMIYASTDGSSFSSQLVFGPGTDVGGEPIYPRKGFGGAAVGFDEKTGTYIAMGNSEIVQADGVRESFLIYTRSDGPSFSAGEGTIAASASQSVTEGGDQISPPGGATGGDGIHASGCLRFNFSPAGPFTSGSIEGGFIPGSISDLLPMGDMIGGNILSFCFKSGEQSESDEAAAKPPPPGKFACIALNSENSGGVFIARTGGGFTKTHSGTGIEGRAAVAVGKISFLGTS
jgi:hypothetical protein